MTPEVSIIAIGYNEEKHIIRCLESLAAQDAGNVEILFVDDGSTDGTAEKALAFAKTDDRVRVIRQPRNMGMAAARYAGFLAGRGAWITFVDADDRLTPDAVSFALACAKENAYDVVEFGMELVPDEDNPPDDERFRSLVKRFQSEDRTYLQCTPRVLLNAGLRTREITWNLVHKLYRREILEKAYAFYRNEYVNDTEDMLISFGVFCHAKSYRSLSEKKYLYTIGTGLTTQGGITLSRFSRTMKDYFTIRTLLRKQGTGMSEAYADDISEGLRLVEEFQDTNVCSTVVSRMDQEDVRAFIREMSRYYTGEEMGTVLVNYFRHYVHDEIKPYIASTEECLHQTEAYAQGILHSPSYRIGHAVTAPVRLLQKLMRRKA